MATIKDIQRLPVDIRRLIYSFDGTFKIVFNKVLKELKYYTQSFGYSPITRQIEGWNTITLKDKYHNNPIFSFEHYRIYSYNAYENGYTKYKLTSSGRWFNNDRQMFYLPLVLILKYFYIDYDFENYYEEDSESEAETASGEDEDEDEDDV